MARIVSVDMAGMVEVKWLDGDDDAAAAATVKVMQ